MITFLMWVCAVLLVAVPYFKVGRQAAVKEFPSIFEKNWAAHKKQWPILSLLGDEDKHNLGHGERYYREIRSSSMTEAKVWVWFWPLLYASRGIKSISGPNLKQQMLALDPMYQEEKRKELEESIAQLEATNEQLKRDARLRELQYNDRERGYR